MADPLAQPDPRAAAPVHPRAHTFSALRPLGLDAVTIIDGPWAAWQQANRAVTIPHAFEWLERDGTIDNLRRLDPTAGGAPERRGLWFSDSDLYKALEGVAWEYSRLPSAQLAELLAKTTAIIARAQEPDGYLNSFVQAGLDVRWDNLVKSHELYCIGHLIQAGIADVRATGHRDLLDVAVRAADLVVAVFGDGRRHDLDGHEEIEMALVELYRETGNDAYVHLARQFIDDRGHGSLSSPDSPDADYFQDGVPVRDQTTVVGHAVRAVYLLAGVVDLYLETGERDLLDAVVRQWESMTAQKSYLTGALGSRIDGEAFGDPYELPPDLGYGETCASIGNVMLSWRLLLATGQSQFADAIERILYNLVSASTSIEANAFFYNNPAQRRAARPAAPTDSRPTRADAPGTRPPWFECACCPPNVLRTIASLAGYVATSSTTGVQLHQFMPARVIAHLHEGDGGDAVGLEVTTAYPTDAVVRVAITRTPDDPWTLSLRSPSWATGACVRVNGEAQTTEPGRTGYLDIRRAWRAGDRVELTLPIEARLTVAHPAVDALRGTVAVERGPVVYALESIDQEAGVDLDRVELLSGAPLGIERAQLLGRPVPVVVASGILRDDESWSARGYAPLDAAPAAATTPATLRFIPYALWANRGPSTMRIHLPYRHSDA